MRHGQLAALLMGLGTVAALGQDGPIFAAGGRQTFTDAEVRAVADELNRRAAAIILLNHQLDELIEKNEVLRAKHPCA